MSSDWIDSVLSDVISVNPKEELKKGKSAKKIAMEQLQPFYKKISGFTIGDYSGGAKFRNGDTLLARITPCLENGKTAYVDILEQDETAFGSTEFIVMRAKPGKTDDLFTYYLASSPVFRAVAIQSMTGTSGRQRVQNRLLENATFRIPPLAEQFAIGKLLASLDDKIELNNRINKTLEEMAQALFNQWFVDFDFPDENGQPYKSSGGEMVESELGQIPKGWRIATLGACVTTVDNRGKTPPLSENKTGYPVIDVKALSGKSRIIHYNNCTKYVVKDIYDNWFRSGHPKELDVLISTVGSIGALKLYYGSRGCIAQNVVAFRSRKIPAHYLFQYLQYIKDDLVSYDIGSVQPSIKVTHIIKHKILVPDAEILLTFEDIIKRMSEQIFANENQIQTLVSLRDALLPKLMSGEIRVPVEEVAADV